MIAEPQALLTELFSSIQGEGPHVGRRHLFVRFYGCHRRCEFCDTPETVTAWQQPGYRPTTVEVEDPPGSGHHRCLDNPVSISTLMSIIEGWDQPRGLHHAVVATGGEPLLQAGFLAAWFPAVRERGLATYLETSGDLYPELEPLLPVTDIVAMDLKLPSVTGNEAAWGQHRRFLSLCLKANVEVFVKIVVSADTREDELDQAVAVMVEAGGRVPVIVQPVTPRGSVTHPPTMDQLLRWHRCLAGSLDDVRILPQTHKLLGAK